MREDSVVIPKKYWLRDEKRYLTIQEAVSLEKKFHWKALYDKRSMDRLGFDVIPNSSEEIAGAMFEINDRIDGTWQGASFPITELLEKHSMGKHSKAFLGSKFSEKHGVAVPADCATQWRR